ncbi:MAG TPA: alpha/beta hydrolase [Pseudolysinimonas sp.]|nr:alpha/beta hydrolase [Pseudolysinimonas sp.]
MPVTHHPDPSAERAHIRGQEIAFRRAGSGPTLVFLSTVALSGRWLPIYGQLAEHFEVIVPDLPGFGLSPQGESMRDIDDLVFTLAEFLDELGVGKFDLVGHSFGGWVAAEFAAFYPDRIGALVLITPMGVRVQGEAVADLFRQDAQGRLNLMLNGNTDLLVDESDEEPLERLLQDFHDLTGFGRFAWNPRYDIRLDVRLGRVKNRALIIGADDDRVVPASHAARFAELLPNSQQLTIHGTTAPTGHAVHVQEPAVVAAAIDNFVGGHYA